MVRICKDNLINQIFYLQDIVQSYEIIRSKQKMLDI